MTLRRATATGACSLPSGCTTNEPCACTPASSQVMVTVPARSLPRAAQLYVTFIIVSGAIVLAAWVPFTYPRPLLFLLVLAAACLTAAWKVNLPIPLASSATLSVSSTTSLATLLLLGAQHAVAVDVAGAWVQCTCHARRSYPWYRTIFSASAHAMTMAATAITLVTPMTMPRMVSAERSLLAVTPRRAVRRLCEINMPGS